MKRGLLLSLLLAAVGFTVVNSCVPVDWYVNHDPDLYGSDRVAGPWRREFQSWPDD